MMTRCIESIILMNEVLAVDRAQRIVRLMDTDVPFDYLILAPMSRHFFGKEDWGTLAPGLKTLADALSIREHIALIRIGGACPRNSSGA